MLHASSPQAPYVSTASGIHCQPSSELFFMFTRFCSFCSHTSRNPHFGNILGLSDEVTVLSKAAVSLIPQLDTRISAGQVLSSLLPKQHPAIRQAGNEAP